MSPYRFPSVDEGRGGEGGRENREISPAASPTAYSSFVDFPESVAPGTVPVTQRSELGKFGSPKTF